MWAVIERVQDAALLTVGALVIVPLESLTRHGAVVDGDKEVALLTTAVCSRAVGGDGGGAYHGVASTSKSTVIRFPSGNLTLKRIPVVCGSNLIASS